MSVLNLFAPLPSPTQKLFLSYPCKVQENKIVSRVGEWYHKTKFDTISEMQDDNKQIPTTNELILYRLSQIESKFDDFSKNGTRNFVTQDQFDPIKRLVYGVAGVILTSVIISALGLIITKGAI